MHNVNHFKKSSSMSPDHVTSTILVYHVLHRGKTYENLFYWDFGQIYDNCTNNDNNKKNFAIQQDGLGSGVVSGLYTEISSLFSDNFNRSAYNFLLY